MDIVIRESPLAPLLRKLRMVSFVEPFANAGDSFSK